MNEPRARLRAMQPVTACIVASVVVLTGALLAHIVHSRASIDERSPASNAEVAASLAFGVAWIWPNSNGPKGERGDVAPYREAAVLVESMVLRAAGIERGGRTRPLILPAGVRLLPVVHVEAAADAPADLTPAQRDAVVAAVRRHAGTAAAGAGLLQLDFEAPSRTRDSYLRLISAVREALPAGVRLSVTVLAHWCAQGDWLDHLPVDEVVPMLYRLGPHSDAWRRRFDQGDATLARRCRGPALGFVTNDPPPSNLLARTARPYWFDEAAWSNPSHPPRHLIP
jgi:hypothetical protein